MGMGPNNIGGRNIVRQMWHGMSRRASTAVQPPSSDARSAYRTAVPRRTWAAAAKWGVASLFTQAACNGDAAIYAGAAAAAAAMLFFGYLKYFERYTLYGRFTVSKTRQELYGNFAAVIEADHWHHVRKIRKTAVKLSKTNSEAPQHLHYELAARAHLVPTSELGEWGLLGFGTTINNVAIFQELLKRGVWGTIEGEWGQVERVLQHARDFYSIEARSEYSNLLVRSDRAQPGVIPNHVFRMAACMEQHVDSMLDVYSVLLHRGAEEEAAAVRLHMNQVRGPHGEHEILLRLYARDITLFERAVREGDWHTVGQVLSCAKQDFMGFPIDDYRSIIASHADDGMPTDVLLAAASLHGFDERLAFFGKLIADERWNPLQRIMENATDDLDYYIDRSLGNALENNPAALPDDIIAVAIRTIKSLHKLGELIDHLQRRGAWEVLRGIFEQPGDTFTVETLTWIKRHVGLYAESFGMPHDILAAVAKIPSDVDVTSFVFEVLCRRKAYGHMQDVLDHARENFDEETNTALLRIAREYSPQTSSDRGTGYAAGGHSSRTSSSSYGSGFSGGFGSFEDFLRGFFGHLGADFFGSAGRAGAGASAGAGTPDYYATLGISRTASAEEIKRAYRKLAKRHHPDLIQSQDDEAATERAKKRFQEISDAYAVLSNSEKRRMYDRFGFVL